MNIWYGTNENAALSNLAFRPFEFGGRRYVSVEHAYQCLKSGRFDERTYNLNWKNGGKRLGRFRVNREISLSLMEELITASFVQNPASLNKLLATGNRTLTHRQDRGFWRNAFPAILMKLRSSQTSKEI